MKALKFAHVYGNYQVDVYDSLEEAIEAAIYLSDMGAESMDYIECEGHKYTFNSKAYKDIEEKRYQTYREEQAKRPKATHWIMVKDNRGNWAHAEPVASTADTRIRELRALVGDDRVKLKRVNK